MRTKSFLTLAILSIALCGCATGKTDRVIKGIPNLHVVDAGQHIYRGGEPMDSNAWLVVRDVLQVTNVIKLNTESESTDAPAAALGLRIVRVPITKWQQTLGDVKLSQIQYAVSNSVPGTFIHCGSDKRSHSKIDGKRNSRGGQDRTGLVCACYEVWVLKWPKAKAEADMKAKGFHPILFGLWEFWEDKVK